MTTKKTTTVREYDAEGRLVKETVTTDEQVTTYWPMWNACCCPSTYCPLHPYGYRKPTITWVNTLAHSNSTQRREVAGL